MSLTLDHLVLFVPSLSRAIAQFTTLGFEVIPGGQHAFTENALIVFEDETYLELLALKTGLQGAVIRAATASGWIGWTARRATDMNWRLRHWVTQHHGSIDWCVRGEDVDQVIVDWTGPEVASLGSELYSRERPDGRIARWRLGSPQDRELPFVLTDLTERALRIPPVGRPHSNGALGIRQIWLSVADLGVARQRFDSRFERADDGSSETYAVGGVRVTLVDGSHHRGRCAVELRSREGESVTLDPGQTFGMSIRVTPDSVEDGER